MSPTTFVLYVAEEFGFVADFGNHNPFIIIFDGETICEVNISTATIIATRKFLTMSITAFQSLKIFVNDNAIEVSVQIKFRLKINRSSTTFENDCRARRMNLELILLTRCAIITADY